MRRKQAFFSYLTLTILVSFFIINCSKKEETVNGQIEQEPMVVTGEEAILFIGNSHTFYNQGLSRHLIKFRANDNLDFIPLIQEAAIGGYTLQDHLMDISTLNKINERSWDAIIFQENSFVASEVQPASIDAMKELSELVATKGTKVFLFMTWPYKNDSGMLTGIKETYQKGAVATGATIVPVGLDWQAIDQNEEVPLDLYFPDNVHPSLEGTFYASAMFYSAIYGIPPSNNPYNAGLGNEVANYLKTNAN